MDTKYEICWGGGSENLSKTKLKRFPFRFAAKWYIFASAVGGVSVETIP